MRIFWEPFKNEFGFSLPWRVKKQKIKNLFVRKSAYSFMWPLVLLSSFSCWQLQQIKKLPMNSWTRFLWLEKSGIHVEIMITLVVKRSMYWKFDIWHMYVTFFCHVCKSVSVPLTVIWFPFIPFNATTCAVCQTWPFLSKNSVRHSLISAVSISAIFDLPHFIILSYFPPL